MEQRLANTWHMTVNEKKFIETALLSDLRTDGRHLSDYRDFTIQFGREDGSCDVKLGQTRVMAFVTAQLVQPFRDKPNEGSLAIYTEFSPMADPAFEAGRPGESAVELGRIIDRGLRESRAVDMESLCVLTGVLVWSIRVDLHILDNGGNLVDAANIAALAALMTFRRPECTHGGDDGLDVVVHSPEEREPLPLIVHHLPIAVTFAFITDNNILVVDPTYYEEAVMVGRMILTVNSNGDVCSIQKAGGVGVERTVITQCLQTAVLKAADITYQIKDAVESYKKERFDCNIKRLSLAFLDINPPSSGSTEHLDKYSCEMQESKQPSIASDVCSVSGYIDTKVQEPSSSGMAHASDNMSKSFNRGPSCWDPYSKGVDSEYLRASLSSHGKPMHNKEIEQVTERPLLKGYSTEPVTRRSPLQVSNVASNLGFGASGMRTLKDAVKPKNKRKVSSATTTS